MSHQRAFAGGLSWTVLEDQFMENEGCITAQFTKYSFTFGQLQLNS